MKATGIVRRIDDLGRVVIPKEIRYDDMDTVGEVCAWDERVRKESGMEVIHKR